MKLLVTGATGQLGSLVVKHLLAKVPAEQIGGQCSRSAKSSTFEGSWGGCTPRRLHTARYTSISVSRD